MTESHSYDRSSKWLIQDHGDSILRLAKITNIERWRPAHAEVVQPRQLPDGHLEVRLQGEAEDDLFLIEVATSEPFVTAIALIALSTLPEEPGLSEAVNRGRAISWRRSLREEACPKRPAHLAPSATPSTSPPPPGRCKRSWRRARPKL